MAVLNPLWKQDPVHYLVLWKFPQLAFSSSGARERSSFSNEQRQKLEDEAEAYREQVASMPADALGELVSQARRDETNRYQEYREIEERARTFNRPEAAADIKHWASASYWSLDEATALSFGKDPRVVTWKLVCAHSYTSPFAKAFADRRDIIYRAGMMGQLAQHTQPSSVIAWARRMHVPMPETLVAEVESLGIQIADWKTLYEHQKKVTEQAQQKVAEVHSAHMAALQDHAASLSESRRHQKELAESYSEILRQNDSLISLKDQRIARHEERIAELEARQAGGSDKPLGERERDSLLRMIIGMAVGGYGYDPKSTRARQTKEIADDLQRAGVGLDADTVRKHLNAAKGLLAGDKIDR